MSIRRGGQGDEGLDQTQEVAAYETARAAADAGADKAAAPKKEEESISVFWRVFGGTILSITALVAITLYNNMSSNIAELRAEVSREREARAELVKKDEFNSRVTTQYERIRGIDACKVELEGLKEKVHANTTAVDGARKDTAAALDGIRKESVAAADAMKKDAAALEVLKERVGLLEGIKKDLAGLDAVKEKLTNTAADLKAVRDDVQKLNGEVDRNKSFDLERKALRDGQHKQVEEALKELQKGLQDCREKLARLEGAKPAAEAPVPGGRPNDPSRAKPAADESAPARPGEVKPAGGPAEPGSAKPGDGE